MKFCLFAFALLLVLLKTNKYNLQQSILNSICMLFWTTLWTTIILPLVISTKQLKKRYRICWSHTQNILWALRTLKSKAQHNLSPALQQQVYPVGDEDGEIFKIIYLTIEVGNPLSIQFSESFLELQIRKTIHFQVCVSIIFL